MGRGPRIPAKGPTFEDDVIGLLKRLMAPGSIAAGVLVRDVDVGPTATRILHGLGYRPSGWIVVRKDVQTLDIWDDEAPAADALHLTAGADATVSLWVF